MKQTVHILATVRKAELLPGTLFVFDSLRTGFPTAQVIVWGNGLADDALAAVRSAAQRAGCVFQNIAPTVHDAWIEALIQRSPEPFWICDTDVVFWEKVEGWFGEDGDAVERVPTWAGRHEPEFIEPWMDTLHVERLHTCLMWLDPVAVRCAMRAWMARMPEPWRDQMDYPFVRLTILPRLGDRPLCYDTLAGLYQASPGRAFTPKQNAAFDHLGCATYADKVELPDVDLAASHKAAFANPTMVRGIWEQQREYYAGRGGAHGVTRPTNGRKFYAIQRS
jgi:hypothetical protein